MNRSAGRKQRRITVALFAERYSWEAIDNDHGLERRRVDHSEDLTRYSLGDLYVVEVAEPGTGPVVWRVLAIDVYGLWGVKELDSTRELRAEEVRR